MSSNTSNIPGNISKNRLIAGGVVFVAGLLSPLLIAVVVNSNLSAKTKTILSGALAFGIPEVGMLLAVMILGKEGFSYLKQILVKLIRKHFVAPQKVSRTRYRVGLLMIILPLLLGWIGPYLSSYLFVDNNKVNLIIALAGDVLFVAGLFVVGGDFWDKLRALFNYKATVTIAEEKDKIV